MYRTSACIYSKLENRAACNTNQNRCRESQKKLSGKGKRVEIKAFICIYIDEAGQNGNKSIHTYESGW